ncbi:calcium/sodium antiporter [Reinekea thalattae]|uniref:Calcium/sodium antiporter n=1 Tax=Reinekea thalattae TaxID=2593301 RepID=A0A5C8ZDY1_9GAMM|nr:calcium/sodium antiporter [Reinekea thalattae]TXR55000.1 calcium/sodium antiporter [Reinekea thalattae]
MVDGLFFLIGIALLTFGGEALIRGSLAAAERLGVSPLLSGLVIVGFGTSAPELVVSVNAALDGQPDIAIGNVVGSNIGNVLLILGLCAVITPLAVRPLALKRDAITVVAASLLFLLLAANHSVSRFDGLILVSLLLLYLVWAYWTERYQAAPSGVVHEAEAQALTSKPKSIIVMTLAVGFGLLMLVFGSQLFLIGVTGLARHFSVPDAVIGLTLVAVGTSLPELSISVIAAIRRHADVAVGNILGSNIVNLLGILGVSALLQPLPIPARVLLFDQWILLATALLLLMFLYTGRRLMRWEGLALLAGYGLYVWFSFTA